MKRRILSILLALGVVLTMLPTALAAGTAWDGTSDITWYNDTDSEFTLTTAEQLAGLADLVDGGNSFAGKTIKLGADIDLYCEGTDEPVSFDPIGDDVAFEGTFDGDGHTISNLYQSGWAFGYEWGSYGSIGLFGELKNATVKNLTIKGAECFVEGGDVGGIAGSASGTCVFENITITDSVFATYNNGNGGIVGWSGEGKYTFKNIDIQSDVVLAGLWGSFDSSIGGVVGQAEPGATYDFENVDIACRIDAYNDCTASYDYYNYRMCGMIIGRLQETTTINGTNYPDTTKYNINCTDVTVTYGDWMDYHYCDPTSGLNGGRGMRVEPGYAYDGLPVDYNHSQCTSHCKEAIPFDQIFGGAQLGVKGLAAYDGVTVKYPTIATIAFYNAELQCKKMVTNFLVGNGNTVQESAFDEAAKNVSATVELPNILTGWTVNGQDFDAKTEVTEDMLNGNLVLVVEPKIEKILTLNFNGVGSQVIKNGETVTIPAPAETNEKPGYHSPGWDAHGGTATELKTGEVLTIDQIYEIILENNEGTIPAAIENDWKKGELNLWATGSDYWVVNTYTVTFNANGGAAVDPQVVKHGETATEPTAPTKVGYTFLHWVDETGEVYDFDTTVTGDIELVAQWEINTADFVFHSNYGDDQIETISYEYGTNVTLPAADMFSREGHTLIGWSTYNSWGNVAYTYEPGRYIGDDHVNLGYSYDNTGTKDEGKIHFYAVWTPNADKMEPKFSAYKVEHYQEKENGTYELVETEFPLYGEIGKNVTAIAKDYETYELNEEKSTVSDILEAATVVDGEPVVTTLKLYYDVKEYTVTFDSNCRIEVPSQTVDYGSTATEPERIFRSGWFFVGWFLEGERTPYDFSTPVTEDITLVAYWLPVHSGNSTPSKPVKPETETPDECDGTYADNCPSAVYIDVNTALWYHEALDFVITEGMMKGTGDGTTFEPNGTMTRSMVWVVLARMEGVNVENASPWYAKAQAWAVENEVSDGTTPNGAITREQLVTMLWRYVGEPNAYLTSLASFSDAEDISGFATQAMAWAVENGILVGSNNMLNPQADATRAEVAAIMMRFCELTQA